MKNLLTYSLCLSLALGPNFILFVPKASAQDLNTFTQGVNALTSGLQSIQNNIFQNNQEYLQQLNSAEAQQIQQNIILTKNDFAQVVRGVVSCLQQNSITPLTPASLISASKSHTLGKTSCNSPKDDIAAFGDLTCGNAESALEAGKKEKSFQQCRAEQLRLLKNSVACFDGFNSKMEQAASKLKQFISQMTSFNQKKITTLTKNIGDLNRAVEMISKEMENEGGYKDQVQRLDNLLSAVEDSLNSSAFSSERTPASVEFEGNKLEGGLIERERHLRETEPANTAMQMFGMIMGGTRQCFDNSSTNCDTSSGSLNTGVCLRQLACAGLQQGPGYEARCQQNMNVLDKISSDIRSAEQFNIPLGDANLNPNDPNLILSAAAQEKERFHTIIESSLSRYENIGTQNSFSGDISNALRTKISQQLSRCFDLNVKLFQKSYNSKTTATPYRQALEALRSKQLTLEGDLNSWMRLLTDRMSRFRTKFTSIFTSTLHQFQSDCGGTGSAGGSVSTIDPNAVSARANQLLGCVQTLTTRLRDGLNGTNGETPTALSIPILSAGANGQASLQNQQVSCTGFKACIQMLENVRKQDSDAVYSTTSIREGEAEKHNQTVEGMIQDAGASFAAAFNNGQGGMAALLNQMNALLSASDIGASLKSSARDPEEFEKNEKSNDDPKSQLYKVPNSILNVMAKQSGLQQLKDEDIQAVKDAIDKKLNNTESGNLGINQKIERANKLMKNAGDKLKKCTPSESDYGSIKNALKCEDISRVCGRGLRSSLGQMDYIANMVSSDNNNNGSRNQGTTQRERNLASFSNCLREQDPLFSFSGTEKLLAQDKVKARSDSDRLSDEFTCYDETIDIVRSLYGTSREDYRGRHTNMLNAYAELVQACDPYRTEYLKKKLSFDETSKNISDAEKERNKTCYQGATKSLDEAEKTFTETKSIMHKTASIEGMDDNIRDNIKDNVISFLDQYASLVKRDIKSGELIDSTFNLKEFLSNPQQSYNSFSQFLGQKNMGQKNIKPITKENFTKWINAISSEINKNNTLQSKIDSLGGILDEIANSYNHCKSQVGEQHELATSRGKRFEDYLNKDYGPSVTSACETLKREVSSLESKAKIKISSDSSDSLFRDAK